MDAVDTTSLVSRSGSEYQFFNDSIDRNVQALDKTRVNGALQA